MNLIKLKMSDYQPLFTLIYMPHTIEQNVQFQGGILIALKNITLLNDKPIDFNMHTI